MVTKRNVHCKVCKNRLSAMELLHYDRWKKKICMDCESQELDEVSSELDKINEEIESVL